MAGAGWQVLLIDADLRRPRIHEIFGLQNTVGLSTLLSPSDEEAPIVFERCVQETEIPGLSVMTSGHIPLNPTEVLGSITMQRRFQEFKQANIFDIMLFDTPPVLIVADGAVLASTIKIPVVMVIEAGETRRGAALKTKERLDQLKIEIAGTVLNSANPKEQGYGNGYSYYYYYSDKS
jgi:capsular exopolysaccharide synthesis family protein